jgi:hypothetical protein
MSNNKEEIIIAKLPLAVKVNTPMPQTKPPKKEDKDYSICSRNNECHNVMDKQNNEK